MPAHRLSSDNYDIARFDVVGRDANNETAFVGHVALAASDCKLACYGVLINVSHMGPPLERDFQLAVHVVGTADLNDDQLRQIELFIDEHFQEQQAQSLRKFANYIVLPHSAFSADRAFRCFSCAGFVLEAYQEIGIILIDTSGQLPQTNLQSLFVLYPELRRCENNPELRERLEIPSRQELGLDGDGPWSVLLPSYIFHSLARGADAIRQSPYKVVDGDQRFPR